MAFNLFSWLAGRLKIRCGSKKAIEKDLSKVGVKVNDSQIDQVTNAVAGVVSNSVVKTAVPAVEQVADKAAPSVVAPLINNAIEGAVSDPSNN